MDAKVGSKSIVAINSEQIVSDGIPGPRITQGTRCPPSKVVPCLFAMDRLNHRGEEKVTMDHCLGVNYIG